MIIILINSLFVWHQARTLCSTYATRTLPVTYNPLWSGAVQKAEVCSHVREGLAQFPCTDLGTSMQLIHVSESR